MPTHRILALVVAAAGCGSQAPPVANKRDDVSEPVRAECVRAVAQELFLLDLQATIGADGARDIGVRWDPPADEDEARAMLRQHEVTEPGESGPLIERCMQRPREYARCRLRATTLDELRHCPT